MIFIVFAEGLCVAGYLYFLAFLAVLAFLLDNVGKTQIYTILYFAVTLACFCFCIIACPEFSTYQKISPSIIHQMFVFNSILVVTLISLFTCIGINLERKVRNDLLLEKNKAEAQSNKISLQNVYLQEIAFMSTHNVRSPLTNIISLTKMLQDETLEPEKQRKIIQYLKQSSDELDSVIHDMISKTDTATKN